MESQQSLANVIQSYNQIINNSVDIEKDLAN